MIFTNESALPAGATGRSMPQPTVWRRLSLVLLSLLITFGARAQAPTSLQYPTPNAFIANVTTVYLAPTLAGSPTGLTFSITPALPAGLSFSTSTGAITGTPTAASTATTYTVTATNGSGSTNTTLVITVTNTFFNNNFAAVTFKSSNGSTDTLQKVGNGQNAGDVILFRNVATISGQSIDCIVKTVSVTGVTVWDAYDQPLTTDGSTFSSNDPNFFSPQVEFGSTGGNVIFAFQFIAGGTYADGSQSGLNVTLQNVRLNTYDIDGNGTASSNQFNEFEGFDSSGVGTATTLKPVVYDPATGLSKFESNISTNNLVVTDDPTRVQLRYSNMSEFRIQVGAGAVGRAYFFLDFSSGPAFNTITRTSPPTLDLNTTTPGTGNGASGCANALAFTAAAQTNAASGTPLTELLVSYENTTANLPDGAGEVLTINGATAGTSSFPLNFAAAGTANVTVGGINYTVTKSVSGTTNTISFKNGATTFALADAETLLDALRFDNSLSVPTAGARTFTVNIRNTQFVSPDAVFIATLGCVAISGNIYHDVNGQTDNTVNASATGTTGTITGQFAAGTTSNLYAILTNTSGLVLASVPISAGGAYTFGRNDPGNYNIYVRNAPAALNSTVTAATYPTYTSGTTTLTYKSTGDNLGATAGTDGITDGKLSITLGSIPVTNANFGLQLAPVTADFTAGNQPNPGGFNYYTVPAADFVTTEFDGSLSTITITAFPTGANYLKIGSVIYTNPTGGVCPPQSTCTTWPGTLTIPYSNVTGGNIAVDPTSAGNTSVSIPYTVTDNGAFGSNNGVPSTITIPFTVPATPISISGNVWDDANADGVKAAAGEPYTAAANTGETLYAILVQTTNTYSGAPTVYAAVPVTATATGYTFTDVPSGNGYEVRIVSLATAPVAGSALSLITPALAASYIGVSTNNNGTITPNLSTNNLVNTLGTVTANKVNVNFGIEQIPVVADYTVGSQLNPGGTTTVPVPVNAFTGNDPEDGTYTAGLNGKSVTIIPGTNGTLYYSGTLIPAGGTTFPAFNPANLSIDPAGTTSIAITATFTYTTKDAAGQSSLPKTVTMPFDAGITISGHVWNDANGDANRVGTEAYTSGGGLVAVLTDANGNVIDYSAVNAATGVYTFTRGVKSTNYKIVLSTATPVLGSNLTTSSLFAPATGAYVNTGVNPGATTGTANTGNKTGILAVTTPATGNVTNQDFGIEQTPVADAKAFTAPAGSFTMNATPAIGGQPSYSINGNSIALTGSAIKSLSGTDAEDCAIASSCTTTRSYKIQTINANTLLYYSGSPVLAGATIPNFDPANLTVYGQKGQGNTPATALGFTYSLIDAAGVASPAVTYTITTTGSPLPVTLSAFTGKVVNCTAELYWQSSYEANSSLYEVQQSVDGGSHFETVATVQSKNSITGSRYDATLAMPGEAAWYRLKMTDIGGGVAYSNTVALRSAGCGTKLVTVSPNPATSAVRISGLQVAASVMVFDATGKAVMSLQGVQNGQLIDISDLAAGSYMLRVTDSGSSTSYLRMTRL